MMRNLNFYAATIFAALASLTLLIGCSDSSDASQTLADHINQYAGVYFLANETVTINADNTQTTVDATMFSETRRNGRRVTPAKGAWRETGENEIVLTNIRFATDTLGSEFDPGGYTNKITFTLTFDEPVMGKSPGFVVSNIVIETFLYNQNPVTDEPIAVSTAAGGARGFRLEAGHSGT